MVNQGENDILVYLGLGGNRFEAPLTFYTGTDPVGLTVADLTGTGVPDLIVANAGSNDLSIFIGVGQGANWELEPRPRLQVGDDPVSTTVGDVNGDGIPDIICVDQGSDDVVVLRGLGNGFFDDNNPLTLPAGLNPIRAFVGTFDAGPGLDLAILDSGSSDLTYYSDFLSSSATAESIPTGGPDPIAGVMGTSSNGYSDLFIAHNGDHSISVLEGGPGGLVLAAPVSLGSSVQPSDLVITPDGSDSLHLYVSAAGEDRVILVTITLGFGIGMTSPGSFALTTPPQGAAARAASLSTTGGSFTVESVSTAISAQVQASTQTETISVAMASAWGQVATSWAGIAMALQQIITPSMAPLTSMVNNLVPMGYVQISDIMPLDNSAIETVAVLLVVPESSVESAISDDLPLLDESMSEALLALENLRPEERGPSRRGSNLERFLSDLDGALNGVPQDVLVAANERNGPWPRWVRRPVDLEMATITATRLGEPEVAKAPIKPDPESEIAPESGSRADVVLSDLRGLHGERSQAVPSDVAPSELFGWARLVSGVLVISSALLGWKAARKWGWIRRSGASSLKNLTIHRPHLRAFSKASRSLGSRVDQGRSSQSGRTRGG